MSKQPWLRLYRDSLHNPKVVTLSDRQHRAWVNCMLMSDNDGYLPSLRDVAVHMRVTRADAEQLVCELVEAELIDPEMMDGQRRYRLHDWQDHQAPSDNAAERMRNLREKRRSEQVQNSSEREPNSYVTDSDPEEETDNNPYTCTDAAREKGGVFDFASLGVGVGSRVVSPEAKLKVCKALNLRECEPLVSAFLDWKPSRKARDLDAMFIKSAPRIFGRMKPDEQKRMLIPPEPDFAPPPIKPSASLLKAVSAANGRR